MRSRLLLVAAVLAVVSGVLGGFPAAARAASGDVLFVVATPGALSAGETAVRTRIAAAGFTVTLADDDTVTAAQASGRALVLIGQSSNSNSAAVKSLAGIAIPVWVAKPYLFDDFGLTGPIAETDYGTKGGAQLTITDPASPMAAGRSGTVTIQSGGQLSWGRPTAAAAVVARAGTAASVFTVAPGATLATGRPAPACRLTFPLYGNGPATFTPDGWALFDAALAWGTGNCSAGPPTDAPPQVNLTAPASGAVVSGTVPVTATASDDVGVAEVRFSFDGAAIGTDTTSPYSVSWDSTGVADGTHTLTATAQDTAGHTATSSVQVTVRQAPNPGGSVLFVVATPVAPTTGETAIRNRLAADGFAVTLADDDTVTAAQASGRSLVLIGQSSNSNSAAVKSLAGIAVPVWVAKPFLFDDFGVTGPIAQTDFGTTSGSQLTITDPASALAAGRSGTVTIQSGGQLSWGRPAAAAAVVARAGTAASVFTVAPGATLATGRPAPACRLTFPLYGNGPATFTPDGWALFDAAAHSAAANCQATPPPPPPPPPPPSGVQHVVLVSIDGLNPQAITTLGAAGTPSLHRIMAEGVSTLDARTEYEATRTLPDHTSMITSRRVDAAAGGHGVIFDDDNGSTVAAAAGSYVAGVFDVVHDSGGTTALYATKPKFDFFDRSWDATNGAPDVTGADNGRDKIDTYARGAATAMTDALQASLLAAPPELSMIHYAGPDGAGHTYGFLSDSYLAEVTRTDALVGELLDTIAGNQALAASTVVIVTSDHGGSGTSHADPTLAADYTVPFLAWGAGVAAGADLYALNPDRADPGTARPDYTAVPQPVRNGEAGNLATGLLGLGPIPGSGLDRDESLDLR